MCRLHAALAELAPGGIAKELNASDAVALLAAIEPANPVEQTRHDLAGELLAKCNSWTLSCRNRIDGSASPSKHPQRP